MKPAFTPIATILCAAGGIPILKFSPIWLECLKMRWVI